ncbi:MAG: hypothetical protein KGZ45_05390 [Clostridium sp.]|nr:hypothetical protein [Clostridium sp.]
MPFTLDLAATTNARRVQVRACTDYINRQGYTISKVEEYVLSKLEAEILNEQTIPVLGQKLYEYYRNDKLETAGEGKHLEQDIHKLISK